MRNLLVLFACAAALCAGAGCSDDDCAPCAPATTEQPLASFEMEMAGGAASAIGDTLRINFVSSEADTLFNLYVTEADEGTVKIINARVYPPFAAATARLSDGTNDSWMFYVRFHPSSTGGGSGALESSWLSGGFTDEFNPDLLGAEITKIWLYLNDVSIVREIGYTNYSVSARAVIMGKI